MVTLENLRFSPYTFGIASINIGPNSVRLGWSRVCDPINLIFVGFTPEDLCERFLKKGWQVTHASGQHMVIHSKFVSSFLQVHEDTEEGKGIGERYHIRFFDAGNAGGSRWILANAHKEYKEYDVGEHIVLSWDFARNHAAWCFRDSRQEWSDVLTQVTWRKKQSDGRAIIIYKQ